MIYLLVLITQTLSLELLCASDAQNETFTRGNYITICMHFVNEITQNSYRLTYDVKIDRYTALQAANSYKNLSSLTDQFTNYSIIVQANKKQLQSPSVHYILNQTNIFPIFSLVVNLDSGNITQLIWDNGCWDSSQECLESTLTNQDNDQYTDSNNYYTNTSCRSDTNSSDYSGCDAKIYVSFIGTDSSDNYMESAGKRISRFRQYSISDMFSSAKSVFNSYYDSVASSVTLL